MNDRVRFHPTVPHDLAAAIKWYDEIAPGLGNRFRQAVGDSFSKVHSQPLLYGVIFDDVRLLRIGGFPYVVHYRIRNEVPYVLGVFHTASNPERWRKRARDAR